MSPVEEELQEFKERFEPHRLERQAHYGELEKLRSQFVKLFPRPKIRDLSLDEYVQGKGSKTSFCYWVEWKTEALGRIQASASPKFGVFFSKMDGDFRFTGRYKDEPNPRAKILSEIDELLVAGEKGDIEAIRNSPVSKMFRGKILFLYFPTKFLNIFSERHVDHYLSRLRANEPGQNLDLILKRERLLQVKNSDQEMRSWTPFEFSDFLYTAVGPPLPRGAELAAKPSDSVSGSDYPSVDETEPELIELRIGESQGSISTAASKHRKTIDFEKRNQRNKRTGDQGEDIVLKFEREHLKRNGKQDLVDKVVPMCRRDDGAGFDILSFELDGREKQIEVKSTTSKIPEANGDFRFYLSANELAQARTHSNYHLYLVFEVASLKPKICPVPHPASLEPNRLKLTPATYRATVTIV